MPNPDIIDISDRETVFSAHESDDEKLFEAIEILAERKGQYLVKWAGVDNKTGKPWPDSWSNKRDCTDDMVIAWKLRKKQQKEASKGKGRKKTSKTRNSTSSKRSETPIASISRRGPSVATTARSTRSTTVQRANDLESEYESVSRTPGISRKRRLSKQVSVDLVSTSDEESLPPAPSRPHKKRRLSSPEVQTVDYDEIPTARSPRKVKAVIKSTADERDVAAKANRTFQPEASASPRRTGIKSSADQRGAIAKENHISIPVASTSRVDKKKPSLLQRHLDRHVPEPPEEPVASSSSPSHKPPSAKPKPPQMPEYDSSDDEIPALNRLPSPAQTPSRRFSLDRPTGSFSLASKSTVLSPRAQARLDQFDMELEARTQQDEEPPEKAKLPLFLPAPSEDPDSLPPSPSASAPRSAGRLHSPVVSDYMCRDDSPPRGPSVVPRPSRKGADDSYRDGVVPETQSSPEHSPSPARSPLPVQPVPSRPSLISKMRARSSKSKTPVSTGVDADTDANGVVHNGVARQLGSVPVMTSQFAPHLPQRRGSRDAEPSDHDADHDADDDEVDTPLSSIEQFSSPLKGRANGKGKRVNGNGKGKARQVDDDDEAHARIVARGVQMAETARAERMARAAAYNEERPRATLSQIIKQTQEGMDTTVTESDIPMASNGVANGRYPGDIEDLREEDEESTQDLLAEQDAITSQRSASSAHSEAEERDDDWALDGAERFAWQEEQHASQMAASQEPVSQEQQPSQEQDVEHPEQEQDHSMQEGQTDDEMQGELSYPPDDPIVEVVPPVTNGDVNNKVQRSGSASRPPKPTDDADIELPPTASTRQNSVEPESTPEDPPDYPRHLATAKSLLNIKSDENRRLEALLAEEREILAAERAKNAELQARIAALEAQPQHAPAAANDDVNDKDVVARCAVAEMRVGILQVSLDAAQADRATVERERDAAQAERDAARRDKATAEEQRDLFRDIYGKATAFVDEKSAENKELQKRITIAEKAAKEGVALVQATFAQREETIRAETKDWRNQANILRELAVRTHDEELRRRAALYPEAQARCKRLEDEREVLNAALGQAHHGIRMKNDELTRLEMRLDERADEREGMKDQIRQASDDIDVKNDEIARLEMRVEEQAAEVERLTGELATAGLSKVDRTVGPDCLVHRCLWRMEVPNAACNALFRDNEELQRHLVMHVPDK